MKAKLLNLISHPALISLLLWLIILVFIPDFFAKYRVRETGSEYYTFAVNCFADLDSDNESEKIRIQEGDPEQTQLLIFKRTSVLQQYNIKNKIAGGISYYFGDYDYDGFSECFIFTMSEDSIFLTIFEPVRKQDYIVRNRFIDLRRKSAQSADVPQIYPIALYAENKGKNRDFIFYITAGFSKQPRRVYRYSIDNDSLICSPESGACLFGSKLVDLNNDKRPEIILDNHATDNLDLNMPFTDHFAWLMVLDVNMNFLFPPVRYTKSPTSLITVPLRINNVTRLVAFNNYFGTDSIKSAFYLIDSKGNQIANKTIDAFDSEFVWIFPDEKNDFSKFYFLKNLDGEIDIIDYNFNVTSRIKFPPIASVNLLARIDADMDGGEEYIFQGRYKNAIIISQTDFSDYVVFRFKEEFPVQYVAQVLRKKERPLLYIEAGDSGIYLEYYKNPLYYLKYPIYLLLYVITLLFVTGIFRLQRYRIRAREEMGKQMAMLQMKAIKNQIDPHFTLNILNSIGSLYASDNNRDQADYIFSKYARMIRATVISSDQIIIPLADELDFIKNYIDLERFRCNNSFSYEINMDPDIDLMKKIPRMLIHTFVENSIKHGLKNAGGDGVLKISVKSEPGRYHITIEDNNSDAGKKEEKGTGKGLSIIKELVDLYFRLEKVQLTFSLDPILSKDNQITGRIARIVIPV
jgi:hypothetical protein